MIKSGFLGALVLVAGAILAGAVRAAPVDLELVLAVDISSSVDFDEYRLQMGGYAAAFRDPRLADAVRAAGDRGIAVTLVHWAGRGQQRRVTGWHRIHDKTSAFGFAEAIDAVVRAFPAGTTDLAGAINFSIDQLDGNGFEGLRRTVDISGDGRANAEVPLEPARDRAIANGVTVNGLAVINDVPALTAYYLAQVIVGPGAFVIEAANFEAFDEALFEKLISEIMGRPIGEDRQSRFASAHNRDSTPARNATKFAPKVSLR